MEGVDNNETAVESGEERRNFSLSFLSDRHILAPWILLALTGTTVTILSIYHVQSVMASWGIFGFSFDDSWIHVQYARTIFEGRAWEYAWGIPSTGSSGPLWSIILSPIFLFGTSHDSVVTSVLFISSILYILNTIVVGEIVRQHTGKWEFGVLAQVVFVLIPRNAGLMLSGMETPLGMLTLFLALLLLNKKEWKYDIALGIVVGFAYLCRPEFVLVAAIAFPTRMVLTLKREGLQKRRILTLFSMFVVAALVVLPWVLHCLNTTGLPLPDSYYSKMRWGVSDDGINLWNIYWYEFWLRTEPYLILGFTGGFILALKGRPYEFLLSVALFALYRLTMPGMSLLFAARYLVPLFDILGVAFVSGLAIALQRFLRDKGSKKPLRPSEKTLLSLVLISILFVPSLMQYNHFVTVHANQASNIEEMQVTLSLWIRENVPVNSTIATYDVGALGYFAEGVVLDLYGLVTPLILHNLTHPFDQAGHLREINCTYVMFYVEWFNYIRSGIVYHGGDTSILFQVHLDDNVVCGTDNMAVYEIAWS
ncbi:MAG: glycosyltransferase family 39 protein [Candidatus Thorarchaeota archaeon]|nr:MAG: glycosyltransferase family 39 protein [Candidatus Thorarchaeota archaeon]